MELALDEILIGSALADIWVNVAPSISKMKPGDVFFLTINYGNRSIIPASQTTLTLSLPENLTFVDADLPPASVHPAITWELNTVGAGSIAVLIAVDLTAPLGEYLTGNASIVTPDGENYLDNNSADFSVLVNYLVYVPFLTR